MDPHDRQEIEQMNSGENGWAGDPADMNGEECEGTGVDGCEHHDKRINLERCTVQCMVCETDLMSLDAFVTLSPRAMRVRQ